MENFECLECGSHSTAIVENDDIKSSEKVKRHQCLECNSVKLVKTCPNCDSVGLLWDDKRSEISCTVCGTVVECPPPYSKDFLKVIPFSQVIRENVTLDSNKAPRYRTSRPALYRFKKAEYEVLGTVESCDKHWHELWDYNDYRKY